MVVKPPVSGLETAPPVAALLTEGLGMLGLDLPGERRDALLRFVALLRKWNQVHNLTAIEQPADIVTRHLLDSLSVAPFLYGDRVADVGSGGGFPGLPLAAARPDLWFTLIDSRDKRARFLRQAVVETGFRNVEVVADRVEHYAPEMRFGTVVARAFGSIADFTRCAGHLRADDGVLLAMKGTYPAEELAEAHGPYSAEVVSVRVPMLAAERHVVILRGL